MGKRLDPMYNLKRVSALVKYEQWEQMTKVRDQFGIPFTRQVRDALALYLKRYKL